ncbi:MAG TPA: Gfo/Idh/MocA family oxidoreductase [Chloroflexia bacterium]|nr:Gfo/Idh/MocA family oxidoreductase [Chloroflexia bacterium]
MSTQRTLKLGIIGAGNIAGPYLRDLPHYPELEVLGIADILPERAAAVAAQYGIHAYPSVEALLADPAVELAVNLTVHHAHTAVTTACLNAGKHVHSEKPLAMRYADAAALVALARERGLRLACSPFTLMGEAQQTAWKWVRDGKLGRVRVAYADVNWGRIEAWHPDPQAFYEVGPLFDVGVYPLSILTAMFGPARRVSAYGTVLWPERETKQGVRFGVAQPDFVVAAIELADGVLVRLTTDFYVGNKSTRQVGIELHGDQGSLHLESWHMFNAKVAFAPFDQPLAEVPLVREPPYGTPWGQGLLETATALFAGRPHRFTGEMAAHTVEILEATAEAARSGRTVAIHSDFPRPAPLEWAL